MEQIDDREKGYVDVYLTLENNDFYFVEVTTLKFLSYLMENVEGKFLPPDYSYILVSKLKPQIIKEAVQEYVDAKDDSYWLKLYHVARTLKIEELNEILIKKEQEEREFSLTQKTLEDEEESDITS